MSYVYIKSIIPESEPPSWTVGFYAPDGIFETDSNHPTPAAAAKRVHWLNGGALEEVYTLAHTKAAICKHLDEIRILVLQSGDKTLKHKACNTGALRGFYEFVAAKEVPNERE